MLPLSRSCLWALVVAAALVFPGAALADPLKPFTGTTLDGEVFDAAQFLGRTPMLLDFGSIYCSSCVTSLPHLINLQNRYGPEKLRVVGVNLDAYGLARVRRFYAAYQKTLNFPVVIDEDLKISRAYQVTTLPTYVVVDREGRAAATVVGFGESQRVELDRAVRRVMESGPAAVAVPAAPGVTLLTPDSFTKTSQSSVSVVGLTGGNAGPFTLRLNGGSERQARALGKMFWVRTPLSLGSNYIEVRYPDGGQTATQAVVVFREPTVGEGLQVAFPEFQFHTPDKEARCAPCHPMDPGAKGTDATTFCLRCHEYLGGQPWVHGPIPVGGCGPCHDFNSKPHKYDLLEQGAELCFTCHDDIREKFARGFLHGPVAMGQCTVCHSPHASSFKFQIRQTQGDLCLSCHESMKPKAAQFVQHRPFGEGQCTGCHDPHASDNPAFFLKGVGNGLCAMCHRPEAMATHKHPVGREPRFAVAAMRLDPQGKLVCVSCHDPHASDGDHMSPVRGGCGGCHKM
ncbi:MAG: cytochrome c3 family protein [Deferrisomatales bacterium]